MCPCLLNIRLLHAVCGGTGTNTKEGRGVGESGGVQRQYRRLEDTGWAIEVYSTSQVSAHPRYLTLLTDSDYFNCSSCSTSNLSVNQPRAVNFILNTHKENCGYCNLPLQQDTHFLFALLLNLTSEPTLYSGTDISGEVVSVGPGVVEFVPGDKIFSWIDLLV